MTTVSGSNAKAVERIASAMPPLPPRPTQAPQVSFRSVLLGSSGSGGTASEDEPSELGDGLASSLALPAPAPPLGWGWMVGVGYGAAPKEPPPVVDNGGGGGNAPPEMPDVDLVALAHASAGVSDPLDPIHRQRAALGPPEGSSANVVVAQPGMPMVQNAAPPDLVRAQASLEDLIPELVRRVQWSGDGRKGAVRMELAGAMEGSTLLISADAGRVRVHLDVPAGVDASGWQERITQRLAARNIPTDSVEVT